MDVVFKKTRRKKAQLGEFVERMWTGYSVIELGCRQLCSPVFFVGAILFSEL